VKVLVSSRQYKGVNHKHFSCYFLTTGLQLILLVFPCIQLPRFYGPRGRYPRQFSHQKS
jgi:hypothetical protein